MFEIGGPAPAPAALGADVVFPVLEQARLTPAAAPLGEVHYLSAAEATACTVTHEAQAQRPWDLWKAEAMRRRATSGWSANSIDRSHL
ncbi:hypothetical protein [Gemmobacter sp.]|uniref:hypothetical protein n=1 Tax=Gemmobacter sp. TaxID=1898957 RepID=UPI002B0032EF|nr:hypothetical protein [Gemmobacter sp.]